ncbi:MAG: hypothetical protein ACE5HL_04320 [Terriglobia bacterium]
MKFPAAFFIGLLLLALPTAAGAEPSDDRVQVGQDIVVEADEVVTDAVCIGCSIRVRGRVSADAVAIGGSIKIGGSVGADAVAIGGGVEINGSVGTDAVAVGGDVRLGPEARVGGDVLAAGGEVKRDPRARIGGEVVSGRAAAAGLGSLLVFFLLICAAINLVLVLLAYGIAGAQRVETVAGTVRARAGLALLAGVGVLVGAVILFIISAFLGPATFILALLVSLALFITLVLGYSGLSWWLWRSLSPRSGPLAAVLLGAVVITILQLIPFAGFLIFLVFALLALGSAALSGYGTATNWLPQQLSTPTSIPPPSPPAAR